MSHIIRKNLGTFIPCELKKVDITDDCKNKINKLKKQLIFKNICSTFLYLFFIFIIIVISCSLEDDIKLGDLIWGILILMTSFLYLLYSLKEFIQDIFFLKNNTYKKAEYGKVKGKIYHKHKSIGCVAVYLDGKSRFISNAICDKKTYKNLNINDDVLVVSFGNKVVYCINYKDYKQVKLKKSKKN